MLLPNAIGYIDRLNMEIKDALSTAVFEVLEKDNYVAWSVRVKTYLMAQDLWEIVEATTLPPKQDSSKKKKQEQSKQEGDEAASKAWRKKNSMALNVLQVSCGPNALSEIREISLAKSAWNILAEKYNVPKNTNSGLSLSLSLYLHVKNAHTYSNKSCF